MKMRFGISEKAGIITGSIFGHLPHFVVADVVVAVKLHRHRHSR